MKVVVADTRALISLGIVNKLDLITAVFNEFYLPNAVWEELVKYSNPNFDESTLTLLKPRVKFISSINYLSSIMDYGESESVILYNEIEADYLLIDDQKARQIAESLGIKCIGSIGLLIQAKKTGKLKRLKPIFDLWISNERYFSKKLLNKILLSLGEEPL